MPKVLSRVASFLALLLCLAAIASADDELVREFKKYFKKYKDPAVRIEAVLSLEGTDTPAVVDALVPVLKDKQSAVVDAAVRVLGGLKSPPAVDALVERVGEESKEPVRVGLLRAVGLGGYTLPQEVAEECLSDKSWEVRRRAAKAVAAGGGAGWTIDAEDVLLPLVDDPEVAVRCAALEGLAELETDRVREPALRCLEDDSWQVRASAILALGRVRHKDSIEPLIARMEVEEGRLRADIGTALNEITGRRYGDRLELWQRFWNNYKDRFEIPTEAERRKLKEAQSKAEAQYSSKKVSYHGIETPSRRILFVIDVSGSMENRVVEKDRFEGGDYEELSRIGIVRTELWRTVERLEPYTKFNILSFATDVKPWKKKLVAANVVNKSSAESWIERLEAIGGNSRTHLAQAGLTGTANLAAGRTNTHLALMTALEAAGGGLRDKHYEVAVDTIFFLSDGKPSVGKYVDQDEILREVEAANELRKVVIHTIAIGEFDKNFMRRLAETSGGVFVDLGR